MLDLTTWAQFGLAGLVAGAAFLLVGRVLAWSLSHVTRSAGETPNAEERAAWHKLQADADVAAQTMRRWDTKVVAGGFDCAWRGRDEVLPLIQALQRNQETSTEILAELRHLVRELRNSRH
jgi:hypothetical protein